MNDKIIIRYIPVILFSMAQIPSRSIELGKKVGIVKKYVKKAFCTSLNNVWVYNKMLKEEDITIDVDKEIRECAFNKTGQIKIVEEFEIKRKNHLDIRLIPVAIKDGSDVEHLPEICEALSREFSTEETVVTIAPEFFALSELDEKINQILVLTIEQLTNAGIPIVL